MKRYVIAAMLVLASGNAVAEEYALRRVQPGDSIGSIAAAYNVSTELVMSYNGLDSTLIRPGDLLKVPYVTAVGGISEAAPRPPAGFFVHTLQSGESLSEIATSYGIT